MAKETKETKETKQPEQKVHKGKSKMTLILGIALFLVAGTAGFFGWKYFKVAKANTAHGDESNSREESHDHQSQGKSKKKSKEKEKGNSEAGATISFEPFLVNLADKEASRYLKASVRLLVTDKEIAEKLAKGDVLMPKMRDTILTILSTKTAADITTNEGKEKLKEEILTRVNQFLPEEDAKEVFFTDFVIQL